MSHKLLRTNINAFKSIHSTAIVAVNHMRQQHCYFVHVIQKKKNNVKLTSNYNYRLISSSSAQYIIVLCSFWYLNAPSISKLRNFYFYLCVVPFHLHETGVISDASELVHTIYFQSEKNMNM